LLPFIDVDGTLSLFLARDVLTRCTHAAFRSSSAPPSHVAAGGYQFKPVADYH
jgi:hypothetical protein